MRLEIPGFSRYYLETEDNRIYSKRYHPISERIICDHTNHYVCRLNITNDYGKDVTIEKHRLVYMAYHPDEDISELQINHLDEDSLNNCPDNLEVCTCKENINYGTGNIRRSLALKGKPNTSKATAVKATVISTGEIEFYNSITEAECVLGIKSGVGECCAKKQHYKSAAGRYWEYYYGD